MTQICREVDISELNGKDLVDNATKIAYKIEDGKIYKYTINIMKKNYKSYKDFIHLIPESYEDQKKLYDELKAKGVKLMKRDTLDERILTYLYRRFKRLES